MRSTTTVAAIASTAACSARSAILAWRRICAGFAGLARLAGLARSADAWRSWPSSWTFRPLQFFEFGYELLKSLLIFLDSSQRQKALDIEKHLRVAF
jgi:hypothetical protein